MSYRTLKCVAKCPTMVGKHLAQMKCQFQECDAIAEKAIAYQNLRRNHTKPILALMADIESIRKMMIRMIQVQKEQINKYWKSIHAERKIVKRGAPPSLEALTSELMINMTLRFIQDLKDNIQDLIEPLVSRVYNNLRKLQQRMMLFKQYTESEYCTRHKSDDCCRCDCPPCRQCQCAECHEGNCSRDVVWDGPVCR